MGLRRSDTIPDRPHDGKALGDLLTEEFIGLKMNRVAGSNPAPAITEIDHWYERLLKDVLFRPPT